MKLENKSVMTPVSRTLSTQNVGKEKNFFLSTLFYPFSFFSSLLSIFLLVELNSIELKTCVNRRIVNYANTSTFSPTHFEGVWKTYFPLSSLSTVCLLMMRISCELPPNRIFRIIHFKVWKYLKVSECRQMREGGICRVIHSLSGIHGMFILSGNQLTEKVEGVCCTTQHVTTAMLYCSCRWSGCLPMCIEVMRLIRSRDEDNMCIRMRKRKNEDT